MRLSVLSQAESAGKGALGRPDSYLASVVQLFDLRIELPRKQRSEPFGFGPGGIIGDLRENRGRISDLIRAATEDIDWANP